MKNPRAAPVVAHSLNGEICGSVFALCVGTVDTFFATLRAWMAVGSVRFSRQFLTVCQWVPVFAHVVSGFKTE